MGFLVIAWRSAFRNRLRTGLTTSGVALAVVAFLFLRTFVAAFYAGVEQSAADRMIVRNKNSIAFLLPRAYIDKLRAVPGVKDVSWANWFGGIYIDEKNFFAQFALDPESFYRMYPEFVLTDEEKKAFFADQTGCSVGESLAEKFGWKVGDRITLKGTIYAGDFPFTIRGIYKGRDKVTDRSQFHFHWKYLDERAPDPAKNQLGWAILSTHADDGAKVSAAVDKLFASSDNETRTESEKAFNLSFISMSATIIGAIQAVSFVVLIIILLVLGNTIAMASRERTGEFAAMRAIGFRPKHIVWLVLAEGLVIGSLGGVVGLLLARPVLRFMAGAIEQSLGAFLGPFEFQWPAAILAVAVCVLGGMLASVLPAWRAGRLVIVDALRRID